MAGLAIPSVPAVPSPVSVAGDHTQLPNTHNIVKIHG